MSAPLDSMPPFATDATEAGAAPRTALARKRTIGALVLATVVVGLGVAAWKLGGPPERSAEARSPVRTAGAIIDRLDRIHDAFPAAPREESCAPSFTPSVVVPIIDFAALDAFRRGQPAMLSVDDPDLSSVSLDVATRAHASGTSLTEDTALLRIGEAEHVAVLKKTAFLAPRSSLGAPEPGRYEGWLVVFDARSARPLCQTRIVAWSSRYVMEPGIGERAIKSDFVDRLRGAVRDGSERLSPNLSLDL
jgi:hypothetical protein